MARKGENIRKRKDGRWEGRYPKGKRDGKNIQGSVFGKTYRETKEKLAKAKADFLEQSKGSDVIQIANFNDTFSAVAEEWLSSKQPIVTESTMARYRTILDVHLLPSFGEKRVTEITRDDILTFSNNLLAHGGKNGNGLEPKTISCIQSVMKNVMDYVRHIKGISVIVFDGLSVKQTQKPLRVFSRIEQNRLNTYLLRDITYIKLGVLICMYMGLRIGELCALKWSDISFKEQKLHVARTMQRIQKPDTKGHKTQVVITPPKSDCSVRDIPIPNEIFQIFLKMKSSENSFVLTGSENVFIEPRTMENHFDKIMRKCQIENATMHTCRHTFATRCVELGFDIKTLSEILGHASVVITMNRYVHPSMELKQLNMNKLSILLEGQKEGQEIL